MADSVEVSLADMPPDIAGAVIEVMSKVGVLAKEDENKFDGYDYASIDAFIKHVREFCHEAGLFIIPQEADEPRLVETQKKNGSPLMMWWTRFAFVLAHKSGVTFGPIHKTVMVQASGAQAAGSAQSYALKQLMRGLFMIPTGDKDDPDKESAEISAVSEQQNDLQAKAQKIKSALEKAADLDALNEVWEGNTLTLDEIQAASAVAYGFLQKAYDANKERIEAA